MSNLIAKNSLDAKQLQLLESELSLKKKSMAVAYILLIFLGQLGIHRFYLGRKGSAIAQLLLTIIGWATFLFVVGYILLAIVGIWVLVDLFLTFKMVNEYNQELENRLVQQIAGMNNH